MKKLLSFTTALVLLAIYAQAQSVRSISLDEAKAYALENSPLYKNAVLDERIAAARVKETVGIGLPQVNGSVQLTHNDRLRRAFFAVGPNNPITAGNPEFDGLPDGSVIAVENFFQLRSSADAGISVNQLIFNGSYLVGLQAANAYKEFSEKSRIQTKEELINNVTRAYYATVINKERVKLFESNIARVDSLLRNTKALFENGFAESIDVDRIQVSLNNLKTERDNFYNLQLLFLENLKMQINYPMAELLDVSESITDLDLQADIASYQQSWSYSNRPDYAVLETQRKLQSLDVKNNYAEGMPSISAFANLGYFTQSPNIPGLFRTETNIPATDFVGPDKYYAYTTFGVSLNIPMFSGLQRSYRVQQSKLTLQKIENGFNSLKAGIDLEIKQALTNYQNSRRSMEAQQSNMELADKIARVTKIKYTEGIGSNLEVIEAESALKEAQINYYNSLYEVIIAKTDLEKAFGKLVDINEK
ncbi:MAG TPA: TolC family protein [Cyclobacteriaceae bacterium]|nr:TolC family protein [Cyclobacteriaceae bacterium]